MDSGRRWPFRRRFGRFARFSLDVPATGMLPSAAMIRHHWTHVACVLTLSLASVVPAAAQTFVNFESGQVRPLALSPDATRLFPLNTPPTHPHPFPPPLAAT